MSYRIRCNFCGWFIKGEDIVNCHFIPDSYFGCEEMLLECKKCKRKEKEMKKIDFTELPIGTKVWSLKHGWGTINHMDCSTHSISVSFDGKYVSFTADGKYHRDDPMSLLFLNQFEIPEEAYQRPRPDLKVDDKVIVWDNNPGTYSQKCHSHFKCWGEDGRIVCYADGKTSWSVGEDVNDTSWNFYELPK